MKLLILKAAQLHFKREPLPHKFHNAPRCCGFVLYTTKFTYHKWFTTSKLLVFGKWFHCFYTLNASVRTFHPLDVEWMLQVSDYRSFYAYVEVFRWKQLKRTQFFHLMILCLINCWNQPITMEFFAACNMRRTGTQTFNQR